MILPTRVSCSDGGTERVEYKVIYKNNRDIADGEYWVSEEFAYQILAWYNEKVVGTGFMGGTELTLEELYELGNGELILDFDGKPGDSRS